MIFTPDYPDDNFNNIVLNEKKQQQADGFLIPY